MHRGEVLSYFSYISGVYFNIGMAVLEPVLTVQPSFFTERQSVSLTSSSTKAEVLAQYNDNLAWEGSPTKAGLALEAVRWLLVNRPTSISTEGRALTWTFLQAEADRLTAYMSKHSTVVNRSTFTRGRML